ncbi:MAG: cytochrome c5 [Rhodothermales bacterium]|jgi:cytochrome c5
MKNYTQSKRNSLMSLSTLLFMLLASFSLQATDYLEPGDSMKGAKTWADNCSRCHNMRDPQDLRDDQWISTAFHMRVRAGLTGQQTRDILEFLQVANNTAVVQTSKQPQSDAITSTGSETYNRSCIACHGADGTGTVPGAPDFTDKEGPLAQSDAVLIDHIRDGFKSPGSTMAMPPKGGDSSLTEGDVKAVLDYIRLTFDQ